jgi:hypothetical protein
VTALLMPGFVEAKVGYQGEQGPPVIDETLEPAPEVQMSEEALLEIERQKAVWEKRMGDTKGFWAGYMNNRKNTASYKEQHLLRREKRKEKRLACRADIRRANRDSLLPESMRCFRATLTMDLEMLRKEQQYVESIAGVTEQYRTAASFHVVNLMEAISTIISSIDVGMYSDKEELLEAKVNLESHYRLSKRMALAQLRVDRSKTWLKHLMVRLHSVLILGGPEEEVVPKIEETIACLEQKEERIFSLFSLEDYSDLEEQFRQVQSEIKFCTEMARKAFILNKELEQAHDEL